MPAHAPRVPPHIGRAPLARLRQAAAHLPQSLQPSDLHLGEPEDADAALDALGLVMLHKGSGQRSSRWIAPQAMDAALAHLDSLGPGPDARTLLRARQLALETIGLVRRLGMWWRRCQAPLAPLPALGVVHVAFEARVPEEPVWAFFRTGDEAALSVALGPPPAYPCAEALRAHLERLLARSREHKARHLSLLAPRLLAACATPRAGSAEDSFDALCTACTREQDRWEAHVDELDTLQGLTSELAFRGYPDTFPVARRLERQVTLYVGPPNSGKTHAAFERLAQALDGAYLAPLRLLALEGRDRLVARGVPCTLRTGEEHVPAEQARVVSSTIEMMDTRRALDVAVIDEAQMIFDASRGWAWTQAIVGVPARELIIIGSAYAVPAIERLLGLCGERCTVREFPRKQHVQYLPTPVPLPQLRLGDAVVAFSRRDVLALRDRIAAAGHPVSVIYGALPPEVRRREAERFAQGDSHILVATDAIGMGLNLPIRRVLFSTLSKFDGVGDRVLDDSEVHQIAGRAGRFGLHDEGFVGVLAGAEPEALAQLQERLQRTPRAPADFKAPVAPSPWHVETIAARLHLNRLHAVLRVFMDQLELDNAHFAVAELEQMLALADELDRSAAGLSLKDRFLYAQAPVDTRADAQVQEFLDWSSQHARSARVSAPWFLDEVNARSRLDRMEQALRACTLWLWLDLRFPGIYGHVEAVHALRGELNDGIERQLQGQRPLAAARRRSRAG